jgi:4-amino-4-deoxy-L-arabinose transferase-like glycosyltransferase
VPVRAGGFSLQLAAIALAALVVRVLHTLLVADDVQGLGDYFFYHDAANLLADGRGYIDPFLSREGDPYPTALHPPLWPFALSVASWLGIEGELGHKLVGAPIGAAVVVLAGLIGRRAAGQRAGLAAAAIAALYPTLIAADASLMSETLYGLFVAAALLLALRLLDSPTVGGAALLGAAIGLAALTRGEALLFVPLVALPLAWSGGRPRRALRLAAVLAGVALVVLPWTARNWSQLDQPILISTNDSTVVAGANCGPAYAGPDKGFWRLDCISERRPGLNEAEQAEIWRDEGIGYARDHLGRLAGVVVPIRILRTWDLWQPNDQIRLAEGRDHTVQRAGNVAYYLLLLLAAGGAWLLLRARREAALVLLSPFVVVTVSSALGFGLPRFRHAAEIAIVVLAGVCAVRIPALVRSFRARRQAGLQAAG